MCLCLDQYREKVRQFWGCVCCIALTGPILVVLGFYFLYAAVKDNRTDLIAQYNTAVDNWNNVYYAQFSQSANYGGFSYSSQNLGTTTGATYIVKGTFAVSNAADALNDSPQSSKEVFKTYTPFKYVTPKAISSAAATYNENWQMSVFVNSTGTSVYYDSSLTPYQSNSVSITCSSSDIDKYGSRTSCVRSKCQSKGSNYYYSNGYCYTDLYASSFCVKVDGSGYSWTAKTSQWSSDTGGCSPKQQRTFYMTSSMPSSVPGEVRSAYDPYVVAARLTDGSMNFGLTAKQNAKAGVALLVIGSIITAIVVFAVVSTLKCVREAFGYNRGYQKVDYVQVQQPQPGYNSAPQPPVQAWQHAAPPAQGWQPSAPPAQPGYYQGAPQGAPQGFYPPPPQGAYGNAPSTPAYQGY